MFNKIMTPIDLAHQDDLKTALQCSADLARQHGAEGVHVAASWPSMPDARS